MQAPERLEPLQGVSQQNTSLRDVGVVWRRGSALTVLSQCCNLNMDTVQAAALSSTAALSNLQFCVEQVISIQLQMSTEDPVHPAGFEWKHTVLDNQVA